MPEGGALEHHHAPAWRARLVTLAHYLTAFVLVTKAISYWPLWAKKGPFIVLCLAEARFPRAQSAIHLAESAVCAVLAWQTHLDGKAGLPYAGAAAASIFLARGLWELGAPRRATNPL